MSSRSLALGLLAGLVVSLTWSGAPGAPASATAKPRPFPGGGVLSPDGKIAYVPSKTKGIEAIRLHDGEVLWSVKDAAQPLLATEQRLYAWAPALGKGNEVSVLVLDTANKGKQVLQSKPLTFPTWVSIGITHGHSFACAAGLYKDRLHLAWKASAWYAGGAAPPPQVAAAARKSADGIARIRLDTGEVEMMDRAEAARAGVALPETPATPGELKQGERTYVIMDQLAASPRRFPPQMKRLLKARDMAGKIVWEHEIKAPIVLVPVP